MRSLILEATCSLWANYIHEHCPTSPRRLCLELDKDLLNVCFDERSHSLNEVISVVWVVDELCTSDATCCVRAVPL